MTVPLMCKERFPTMRCSGYMMIKAPWRWTIVFVMMLNVTLPAYGESSTSLSLSPELTFKTLEGRPVTVSAMRNSVVLLNFWGTWCGPCLEEIPDLIKLSHRFQSRGLKVIGVTLASGSSDDIRAFTEAHGMDYTVVIGDLDEVKRQFQVMGFPASVLIDGEGVIRKRYFGPQTEAGLAEDVMPLLSF